MSVPRPRLTNLVTNDDGELSRTQIVLWIALFLTVGLTIAEVVFARDGKGHVLSWPVLIVLGGLHLFALLDRIQAKYASFRIGKEGAGLTLGAGAGDEHGGGR